jgi:hypothetical protein
MLEMLLGFLLKAEETADLLVLLDRLEAEMFLRLAEEEAEEQQQMEIREEHQRFQQQEQAEEVALIQHLSLQEGTDNGFFLTLLLAHKLLLLQQRVRLE